MHINAHFAIGVIIASIFHALFNFTLLEFGFIILCSFFMDFDILLSKYARDNNHRMLITHSIIPGVILLILGLILQWAAIIISGIAYMIHITVDTLDWGTNFFGVHKKPIGPKFLITNEELEKLDELLADFKVKKSFFEFRYYSNKVIIASELILVIAMIFFISYLAFEYILTSFLYIPLLVFHLIVYLKLKKIENK